MALDLEVKGRGQGTQQVVRSSSRKRQYIIFSIYWLNRLDAAILDNNNISTA